MPSRLISIANAIAQLATNNFESPPVRSALFRSVAEDFNRLSSTFDVPTGTSKFTTFNADETTVVSNPPTQAEVQAINDRLLETRRLLKGVIETLL